MDQKLWDILHRQTVSIRNEKKGHLGTGFFVTDNLVVTAEHCLHHKETEINSVELWIGNQKFCMGSVLSDNSSSIAFIRACQLFKQDDRLPVGHCCGLVHDVPVDIYGYPCAALEGYCLENIKITGNYYDDSNKQCPSIQCAVKNMTGGLDSYEGLSGCPVVVKNCIVGMAATEDNGRDNTNVLHLYDFHFPYFYNQFEEKNIHLKEIILSMDKAERNQNRAVTMSLYQKAWWLIKNSDGHTVISDQYSVILAVLLLGITKSADIILASPWKNGLAECLQEETGKYEKEFPSWSGRQWVEYEDGAMPDWQMLQPRTGVIISIYAGNRSDILFAELLTGRKRLQDDILVMWNIWSEQPEQAVSQALRAGGKFEPGIRADVLTVFSCWQTEPPHPFLVHETAHEWLKKQNQDYLAQDAFLLELNASETDAMTWEVFLQYKADPTEAWGTVLKNLYQMCSGSVRSLISFLEKKEDLASLLESDHSVIKRWFATVKEEDCGRILSCLEQNPSLYWNAVISNPYCVRYIIQELCTGGRKTFVHLLLEQHTNTCNDIMMYDEADTIRQQIRP